MRCQYGFGSHNAVPILFAIVGMSILSFPRSHLPILMEGCNCTGSPIVGKPCNISNPLKFILWELQRHSSLHFFAGYFHSKCDQSTKFSTSTNPSPSAVISPYSLYVGKTDETVDEAKASGSSSVCLQYMIQFEHSTSSSYPMQDLSSCHALYSFSKILIHKEKRICLSALSMKINLIEHIF